MAKKVRQQEPLEGFDVARLRITGVSDEIMDPPDIGYRMKLLIDVECTGHELKKMKDGELRKTALIELLGMEIVSGPTAPTGEPNLEPDGPNLFDDPPEDE